MPYNRSARKRKAVSEQKVRKIAPNQPTSCSANVTRDRKRKHFSDEWETGKAKKGGKKGQLITETQRISKRGSVEASVDKVIQAAKVKRKEPMEKLRSYDAETNKKQGKMKREKSKPYNKDPSKISPNASPCKVRFALVRKSHVPSMDAVVLERNLRKPGSKASNHTQTLLSNKERLPIVPASKRKGYDATTPGGRRTSKRRKNDALLTDDALWRITDDENEAPTDDENEAPTDDENEAPTSDDDSNYLPHESEQVLPSVEDTPTTSSTTKRKASSPKQITADQGTAKEGGIETKSDEISDDRRVGEETDRRKTRKKKVYRLTMPSDETGFLDNGGRELSISCDKCDFKTWLQKRFAHHEKLHNMRDSLLVDVTEGEMNVTTVLEWSQNNTALSCTLCSRFVSMNIQDIYRHLKNDHGQVALKSRCSICGLVSRRSAMPRHLKEHELKAKANNRPKSNINTGDLGVDLKKYVIDTDAGLLALKCDLCGYTSTSPGHFQRHMKSHGELKCPHCPYYTTLQRKYKIHIAKHERPFLCTECSHRSSNTRDHQLHMLGHKAGEEKYPFKCSECEYRCKTKFQFKEHKRKHTGEFLFCDIENCNFKSHYMNALAQHKKTVHSKEKKLVCGECGFSTSDRARLTNHSKKHFETKDIRCPYCPFTARKKSLLMRHLSTVHVSIKRYQCDQCPYKTPYREGLVLHLYSHFGVKPFACSLCEYKSNSKQKTTRHLMQVHRGKQGHCIKGERLQLDMSKYLIENIPTLEVTLNHPDEVKGSYKCDECSLFYQSTRALRHHKMIVHEQGQFVEDANDRTIRRLEKTIVQTETTPMPDVVREDASGKDKPQCSVVLVEKDEHGATSHYNLVPVQQPGKESSVKTKSLVNDGSHVIITDVPAVVIGSGHVLDEDGSAGIASDGGFASPVLVSLLAKTRWRDAMVSSDSQEDAPKMLARVMSTVAEDDGNVAAAAIEGDTVIVIENAGHLDNGNEITLNFTN